MIQSYHISLKTMLYALVAGVDANIGICLKCKCNIVCSFCFVFLIALFCLCHSFYRLLLSDIATKVIGENG